MRNMHDYVLITLTGFFCRYLLLASLSSPLLMTLLQLPPITYMRQLKRCELAGELYILDVPKVELPQWICIAEYESRFNTHIIGNRNEDGSLDYGIFQISDKFWCLPENETDYYVFNECNVNCSALLMDDIREALTCAQIIKRTQGWEAWSVYEEFCNETTSDDVGDCFE